MGKPRIKALSAPQRRAVINLVHAYQIFHERRACATHTPLTRRRLASAAQALRLAQQLTDIEMIADSTLVAFALVPVPSTAQILGNARRAK